MKLAQGFKDKRLSWKQIFQAFKPSDPQKNPHEIRLKDVKTLLKDLKIGLTSDDLDVIINSFSEDPINKAEIERKLLSSREVVETEEDEKAFLIKSLLTGIQEALIREQVQLERLFFDFDEEQNGTLSLAQFSNLVYFLRIDANKQQIRIFFEKVDMDRKGYLTLPELKSFVEESITLRRDEEQEKSGLGQKTEGRREKEKIKIILDKMKGFLVEKRVSLLKSIEKLGFSGDQHMTGKGLEKVLNSLGLVVSKEELDLLLRRIAQEKPINNLSFRDFLELAVRERVEELSSDIKEGLVHPTVAVCIGNIYLMLKKLELGAEELFQYLKRPRKSVIVKKDFLKLMQCIGVSFIADDLQLLYQFFDEKGIGEISQQDFMEKFNLIASLHLSKLREEEMVPSNGNLTGTRRQVFASLGRIKEILKEKGFGRRQALAFFDQNANSMLTRQEFTEGLHMLDPSLSLEEIRVLYTYLDQKEQNLIDLDRFLDMMEEGGREEGGRKEGGGGKREGGGGRRGREVIVRVVEEVGERVEEVLEEVGRFERNVRPEEGWGGLWKVKGGIRFEELLGVFRNNGVKLKEEEKRIINDRFAMRRNKEFLDIEAM